MKTIYICIVLCIISTFELSAYRAPDSCLKSWSSGQYEMHPNPDSIRVDTCEDSLFIFRKVGLIFHWCT